MYRLKAGIKDNPQKRWALPDRIFFGHGACHILAGVYLRKPYISGFYAEKITPLHGLGGNHIFVTDGTIAFDYHGYSLRDNLIGHHKKKWRHTYDYNWDCTISKVHYDLLSTVELNKRKMLGPDQYLNDPIPRAERFLQKVNHLSAMQQTLLRKGKVS